MLIHDPNLKHELDICPNGEVALKYSEHTHVIDGAPQGYSEVDMHCPWWGLDNRQRAALQDIHERAAGLIEEAAKIIMRRL